MSTALARTQDQIRTVQDLLMRSKAQIQNALPRHMTPDRMVRVALTTIRQTPKLLDCDPLSLVKAVLQASALGLEPDPLLGRAYIVPYGREATLIIGYKGLIDLARRSGEIQSIEAHAVYEADAFDYAHGLEERLTFRPADTAVRGKLTHAWALCRFKDGGHQFEVMGFHAIERIRANSKNGSGSIWRDHYEEMARKTVVRRLCKYLPLSPELSSHLAGEEMVDAGMDPGAVFHDPETEALAGEVEPAPSKAAGLARKLAPAAKTEPDYGVELDEPREPGQEG